MRRSERVSSDLKGDRKLLKKSVTNLTREPEVNHFELLRNH
jgi:hypothetical protein